MMKNVGREWFFVEASREPRKPAGQGRKKKLLGSITKGRITLLVILVVSLINQLLLLLDVKYFFLFGASVPYYLNWLGQELSIYHQVTAYKIIAMLLSVAVFAAYVACWMLSARSWKWMRTGLVLYCIDTLFMIVFAIAFLMNPFSCFLWLIIHLIGVGILYKAFRSGQELERRSRRRRAVRQEAEVR